MLIDIHDNIVNSMPNQLVGNVDAFAKMSATAESGRMSRSLIVAGPSGSGRKTFARRLGAVFAAMGRFEPGFADALDAQDSLIQHSARLLGQGAHPDILMIEPEGKKGVISAEAARELQVFQSTTPAFGRGKAAIITNADALNTQSANAILKVLEEPKATLAVILVASQVQSILPTIRSRCAQFALGRLTDTEVEAVVSQYDLSLNPDTLALVNGDAALALTLAKAEIDLGALDQATAFCTGPDTQRLAPSLASGLNALDKALGTAVVSRLLLSKLRSSLRSGSTSITGFDKRIGQRATLSLDSTASWMDALVQLRAMVTSNLR